MRTKGVSKAPSLGTMVWLMIMVVATVVTLTAVRTGKGWRHAGLAIAIAVACALVPRMRARTARAQARRRDRSDGRLTVDDWGVARTVDQRRQAVAWSELASIRIHTTGDGPLAEDMFFVFDGPDGSCCVVPNRLAVATGLLTTLQERLPDLDNKQVAHAAGMCSEAWFTIWKRPSRRSAVPE
jgi:hypothetical protein